MKKISGFLESARHRQTLRRWEALGRTATSAPLRDLRRLRTFAQELGQRVQAVQRTADLRLAKPPVGSTEMKLPPSTDWSHRPALWRIAQTPSGYAPARNEAGFAGEATLYHDDRTNSLSLRQIRNSAPGLLAPYGVQIDIYQFSGSFLSLVVRAPADALDGLTKNHILRLTSHITSERPIEVTARINLKNGPNTEQVSTAVKSRETPVATEFDMAYVPFNETRAEHLWVDLFIDSPPMNVVRLLDLSFSRHRRAEV